MSGMQYLREATSAEWLLRGAVAFSFLYPAVSAWFNPFAWIGYFPSWLLDIVGTYDIMTLLHVFGVTEIVIALWLIFGKDIRIPSAIATLYLAAIVVFNFNQMDVVFRDVSIAVTACALFVMHQQRIHATQDE